MNPNDDIHSMTPDEFKDWLIHSTDYGSFDSPDDQTDSTYDEDGRVKENVNLTPEERRKIALSIIEVAKTDIFDNVEISQIDFILTNEVEREFPNHDVREDIRRFEETDPAIQTLKEKYGDYYKWYEATQIWQDHMDYLISKYGNEKTVLAGAKEGFIPDKVPPYPKLKKTKRNKRLVRMGEIPIRPYPVQWTKEQRMAYYDSCLPSNVKDPDEYPDDFFEIELEEQPKWFRKMVRRAYDARQAVFRRGSIHKKNGRAGDSDLDAIIYFMNSREYHKYDEHGKVEEEAAILDIEERMYQYEYYQPEVLEDRIKGRKVTFINGRFINEDDQDVLDVYDYMIKNGYAEGLAGKKGLPKTTQKLVRAKIARATAGPLTDKQIKKLKKEQKKFEKAEKKRRAMARKADMAIADALCKGDTLFRDANGELLSLRDRLAMFDDD